MEGDKANPKRLISACLNAVTGSLFSWQRASFGRKTLIAPYQALIAAYPEAETI